MSVERREYQDEASMSCERLMAEKTGPVLLVMPTGTGKTVVASKIIKARVDDYHHRPVFIAPRREIVAQAADKLSDFMLEPGIIMAGHRYRPRRMVQVASVDTLRSWIKRGKIVLEPGDLLLVDEAHHSLSQTYRWLIDAYTDSGADVLGMTATPIRSDGQGLGKVYQHLHQGITVTEAIHQGYLVQPDYYVAFVPDMSGVRIKGGDFDDRQCEEIMNQKHLVGDLVDNWLWSCRDLPTLAFGKTVSHSMAIAKQFNAAGIKAVHIDGTTDVRTRDRAIQAMRNGDISVLCNCAVFREGTDIPIVSCIVDADPTKSLGKYLQKLGRGMRPYPGKESLRIMDHAGNFYRNGRIDRDIEWELVEGREVVERDACNRVRERTTFTCHECHRVFSGQLYCPDCGTRVVKTGKMVDYLDAQLVNMTVSQFERIEETMTQRDYRHWYSELLTWARAKNKNGEPRRKDGWAYYAFKEKFKFDPPFAWKDDPPREPGPEVKNYITYLNMRRAKSRDRTG